MDLNILGSFGGFIIEHGGATIVGLTGLITFASFVANFTKTDVDNKIIAVISKAINWAALNVIKK